jgi:hypothetical protein
VPSTPKRPRRFGCLPPDEQNRELGIRSEEEGQSKQVGVMALFSVLGASPAALSSRPASSFIHGSRSAPKSSKRGASSRAATSLSVRCEQGAKQGGGVWLGRAAMIGFASAIAVEVSTGKGFLEVLLHCTSPFVQFSAS